MLFDDLDYHIRKCEENIVLLESYWETTLPRAFCYLAEFRDYVRFLRCMEEDRPSRASEVEDDAT